MYGGSTGHGIYDRASDRTEFGALEELGWDHLRLGQDVRFLFVAVGGGGIRIGRELARRHPRFIETVAIHCDSSVQSLEEFDRRITLEPDPVEFGEGGAGPSTLARAAEPALARVFEGAAFVAVIGSLGGAAGSGLFPTVVEVAARESVVVAAFAVKPFAAESERRGVADRTLGRLPFLPAFVEKQQHGAGRLVVLDNEALARKSPSMPFTGVTAHWADILQAYLEREFVRPAEAALASHRSARIAEASTFEPRGLAGPRPGPTEPEAPIAPFPRELPAALAPPGPADALAELTFEIDGGAPRDGFG